MYDNGGGDSGALNAQLLSYTKSGSSLNISIKTNDSTFEGNLKLFVEVCYTETYDNGSIMG